MPPPLDPLLVVLGGSTANGDESGKRNLWKQPPWSKFIHKYYFSYLDHLHLFDKGRMFSQIVLLGLLYLIFISSLFKSSVSDPEHSERGAKKHEI